MKDKALAVIESLRNLEQEMSSVPPTDTAKTTALARERKRLEPIADSARLWIKLSSDLKALDEILAGTDEAMKELALAEKKEIEPQLAVEEKRLKILLHPRDPRSDRDTIVEIRAGAGGDEAGLFVADLFRMYTRFAQAKGLDVAIMSLNSTGVGGLKEAIFELSGSNAFGWFRFETGVHRVQRVPETEAQGRIHTSTVTVAVLPEPTETEVKVETRDLRIDTYRASGAGGQHVNKTESAIRITHIPSGIVVACQEERSQGQNRLRAMSLLRAKLQEAAEEKLVQERRDMRRKQIGSGDRSEKIRTYNYPQDRITDHRINFSVFNIPKVMDGELGEMIDALQAKEQELAESGALA